MLAPTRFLIVNADDFGQSPGVNEGLSRRVRRGIVTSASLMVRWAAAASAGAYARAHPSLSLGLHVDLGEWAYRQASWVPLYEVVAAEDAAAVADESPASWRPFDASPDVSRPISTRTNTFIRTSRLGPC